MYMRSKESMTKKCRKFIELNAIMCFVLMLLLPSAAWAGPVTDHLRGTIDRIIQVLNDPSLRMADKKDEKRVILHKLVEERFDEQEIARRALGAHWQKRTKEEKQEFVRIFNDLLERTYFEKMDAYLTKADCFSRKNIIYLDETVHGRYAVVETNVKSSEDREIRIDYQLKNKQGNWFVCDIAIEGVSIVKNYRAQFSEILARSSFKELIAELKSKQESEITGNKQ